MSAEERSSQEVISLLNSIILDGAVSKREELQFSMQFGSSYVLKYALLDMKLPYDEDLVNILSPLDRDKRMDEMDKSFVEWIMSHGDDWVKLKGILYHVAIDGNVTEDEMRLVDTVSIIPVLIPDFKALERIPERVYQGRDLSGWETVLSDHPWIHPKEELATLEDVDAIHYGNYSEVRSNVRLRCIAILSATF